MGDQSMYEEFGKYCKDIQISSKSKVMLECSASFLFLEEFIGFNGHFPTNPVMPAIGQLAIVRYVSEQGVGKQLIPKEYNKIKFTGMILPEDKMSVVINLTKVENCYHAEFRILQNDDLKISSGEIIFSF